MHETAQPDPTEPRRRGRYWFWLVLFAALLAALAVGYHHYRSLEDRLDAAIARTNAQDPYWQMDDLLARRLTVADDANGALVVTKVQALLTPSFLAAPEAAALLMLPPETLLSAEQEKTLNQELAGAGAAVAEARKLLALPWGRFPLQVAPNAISTVLRSQDARSAANVLLLDAIQRAHQGDADGAIASCHACLNASRSVGDEPFLISFLIRVAVRASALRALERALAQGTPAAAPLAALQAALEEDERQPLLVASIRGERAGLDQLFREIQAGRTNPRPLMGGGPTGNSFIDDLYLRMAASPTLSHAVVLEYFNDVFEIVNLPPHKRKEARQAKKLDPKQMPILARNLIPAVDRVMEVDLRSLAFVRSAIVALALERHRLEHGSYPEKLEELAPTYLKSIPLDPYDGQPLRYRRLADGVVVYSVGPDGIDDGGAIDRDRPITPNTDQGFRLWDVNARRQPPKESD